MDNTSVPPAATSTNSFSTSLVISMIGIVSTFLLITLYHLVIVKCCLRNQHHTSRAPSFPQGRRHPTGVDDKILQTIPIITYSPQHMCTFQVDQGECVVCLGDLEEEDMVRLLPNCKHAFHVPCIDTWFMSHNNCPVCRSSILAPIPSHHVDDSTRVDLPTLTHGHHHDHTRSCRFLRHCGSLVLSRERIKSRRLGTGMKRSLSVDQALIAVVIDRQNEEGEREGCSTASSSRSRLVK